MRAGGCTDFKFRGLFIAERRRGTAITAAAASFKNWNRCMLFTYYRVSCLILSGFEKRAIFKMYLHSAYSYPELKMDFGKDK